MKRRLLALKGESMELSQRFTPEQLETIIDEASIYMCACPAQVVVAIRKLREIFRYQVSCLSGPQAVPGVHERIVRATIAAHEEMEGCLADILAMEGWDPLTLKMPEGLRIRRDAAIQSGEF